MLGIQVCSNERPCPIPRGDNYKIAKNPLTKFKHLLLQDHLARFNQTWHKASLSDGNSVLFKWRATPFTKERWLQNAKIHWRLLKIIFSIQNNRDNFNQTWHKASFGGRGFKFVQMKGHALFTKEDNYEIAKESIFGWRGLNVLIRTIQFSKRESGVFVHLINVMIYFIDLRKCVYWFELVSQVSDIAHGTLLFQWWQSTNQYYTRTRFKL